jgi:N6-L-threonylcarbamoyladenine synthase
MNILAIETSCDETAVALVREKNGRFFVADEYVSSQTKVHSRFGGVVPNLAAREHLKNLPILLEKIIRKNKIGPEKIDFIAATQGPGLIPALLIGTNAAKALAYAWQKPLIGVHHIAGHIYANFLTPPPSPPLTKGGNERGGIKFPILALVVSGGHTELILMKKHIDFKIIGQTLDDAAGEAFDKAAKILGLGYPGGPEIARLANTHQSSTFPLRQTSCRNSSKLNFSLPRPMIDSPNLNFSFSGLKTALLYAVRDNPKILSGYARSGKARKDKKSVAGICAEFQQAVIDVLIHKTIRAAKKHKPKTILLGGGVSANKELRRQLEIAIKKDIPSAKYSIPDTRYSLDNAAMIAAAGYFKFKLVKNKKIFRDNWKNLEADAGLELK